MISIAVDQIVHATPLQIREMLLDHEQLNRFFNAEFKLIRKENDAEIKGGKGAIRQISMMGVKFQELIINADNKQISYRIIGNKPVADHRGDILFSQSDIFGSPSTKITYKINCKPPWWMPNFILSFFIEKDLIEALKKLESNLKGSPQCP
jgi:hypothetical protein